MGKTIELKTFYNYVNQSSENSENKIGHFDLFKVEDLLLPKHKQVNYSRRNFYKVSLVTGHSKIHYADQTIEIAENVLVFTNPMIPFFWERISENHSGYVCIFTEAFINRFGNIKDYAVFQSVNAGVIALTAQEALQFQEIFFKLYDELHGDYSHKYDLLRNLLMELIHMGMKLQPAHGYQVHGTNAAERITG